MSDLRIISWLAQFKTAWLEKDLRALRNLFSNDVEYWETPFVKLEGVDSVIKGWQEIQSQTAIKLDFEQITNDSEMLTVRWNLSYMREQMQYVWAGLYLISLDENGRCSYFYQVGEAQP